MKKTIYPIGMFKQFTEYSNLGYFCVTSTLMRSIAPWLVDYWHREVGGKPKIPMIPMKRIKRELLIIPIIAQHHRDPPKRASCDRFSVIAAGFYRWGGGNGCETKAYFLCVDSDS